MVLGDLQQAITDKVMFAPVVSANSANAVGPGLDNTALGYVKGYAYFAPLEDMQLKENLSK